MHRLDVLSKYHNRNRLGGLYEVFDQVLRLFECQVVRLLLCKAMLDYFFQLVLLGQEIGKVRKLFAIFFLVLWRVKLKPKLFPEF